MLNNLIAGLCHADRTGQRDGRCLLSRGMADSHVTVHAANVRLTAACNIEEVVR